jgi:hypothetical protein
LHRATPLNSSFRGYVAGGARSAVDTIDDSQLMQAMGGNIMAGESRSGVEAPQNYGFTSVVMQATKDALGKITDSAEAVMSFMGGNRSFPVAGVMDDRRHRLFGMQPGDSAMFSTVGRMLQAHLSQDGMFFTAPRDKTARMQLLDQDSQSDQQQQQSSSSSSSSFVTHNGRQYLFVSSPDMRGGIVPSPRNGSSGSGSSGSSGTSGSQGGQQKGQQPLYKKGQQSYRFLDVTKDETRASGTNVRAYLQDGNAYTDVNQDKNVYLGAAKGKAKFALVATLKGPTKNVPGKIG